MRLGRTSVVLSSQRKDLAKLWHTALVCQPLLFYQNTADLRPRFRKKEFEMLDKGNIATDEGRFTPHESECTARLYKRGGCVCKAMCCACQNGVRGFAMKRFVLAAIVLAVCAVGFAYNPPYGGEEPFRLTNPEMMMGAASASGGPAFTVLPSSITYNPAIPAGQQHITADFSMTLFLNCDEQGDSGLSAEDYAKAQGDLVRALTNGTITSYEYEEQASDLADKYISGGYDDDGAGFGFQTGMIIPTEQVVLSFTMNYMFSEMYGMYLGNTFIMHGGASKELNEKLSVGANAYIGFGSCFSIGTDAGVLLKLDDMGRFKNPRLGLALLNLGISSAVDSTVVGIDDSKADYYPAPLTSRASFGATFFEKESWTGAFSVDASIPFFQNFITDAAIAFCYNNFMTLSASMQFNIREIAEGGSDGLSWFSLGVSFKLGGSKSGKSTEVTPSFATQCLYSGILALSGGVRLDMAPKGSEAPAKEE